MKCAALPACQCVGVRPPAGCVQWCWVTWARLGCTGPVLLRGTPGGDEALLTAMATGTATAEDDSRAGTCPTIAVELPDLLASASEAIL